MVGNEEGATLPAAWLISAAMLAAAVARLAAEEGCPAAVDPAAWWWKWAWWCWCSWLGWLEGKSRYQLLAAWAPPLLPPPDPTLRPPRRG